MKVICPECSAQFDVPVPLLGAGGRRVRCGNCSHVWFADADSGESYSGFNRFDESLDIEPIPSSVHPEDGDDLSHDSAGPSLLSGINKGYLLRLTGGFGLACVIFAVLLGVGVLTGMNGGALRPLYAPFGLAAAPTEKPLVIENIVAKAAHDAAGQPYLAINGQIRNTTGNKVPLRTLEVAALTEAGGEGDAALIKPGDKVLEPEQAITFEAQIPGQPDPKGRVRLRFVD